MDDPGGLGAMAPVRIVHALASVRPAVQVLARVRLR